MIVMPDERLKSRGEELRDGLKAGGTIGLGYYAVAFSLGITARDVGISPLQGFLNSLLVHASAGEYAGLRAIADGASYWEMALVILIANARYLLMSAAMSQRLAPTASLWSRFWIGFLNSDEVFAVNMLRPRPLSPWFVYGAGWTAFFLWACGAASGIAAGNLLPEAIVSALSVALYGMFLAVILPAGRKNTVLLGLVGCAFLASALTERLLPGLSEGGRVILLTLLLAGTAAALFPVREGEEGERDGA